MLQTEPQHELSAALLLSSRFEQYLPLYTQRSRRKYRPDLKKPLFTGYLFCRFPYGRRFQVIDTPGVVRIVQFGDRPATLTNEEIQQVRDMEAAGAKPIEAQIRPGALVDFKFGKSTLQGRLERIDGQDYAVVRIEIMNRSVAIKVYSSDVRLAA